MALNRIALNKVSIKRMTVPGTGGGSTPAPAGPTSYSASIVFTGSQTWTPPSGVTSVDYLVIGGGGSGGSGVVIIRYPAVFGNVSNSGSPDVSVTPTGFIHYTFTGSGSITFDYNP